MKKTAVFLVFTLLLTMLGGMTTVWAANEVTDNPTLMTTITVDDETGAEISPLYYTRATSSALNTTDGSVYFADNSEFPDYLWLASKEGVWLDYDLDVEKAGNYKVIVKAGTSSNTNYQSAIVLNSGIYVQDTGVSTRLATTRLISKYVPTTSMYGSNEIELGVIKLGQGINTIGITNNGQNVTVVYAIKIVPVESEETIKDTTTIKRVDDKDSNSVGVSTASVDSSDSEQYAMLNTYLESSKKALLHKVNVKESGDYLLSVNYSNYYASGYAHALTVYSGTDVSAMDSWTNLGKFGLYAKTTDANTSPELVNVPLGIVSLTAGEQYLQFRAYPDLHIGKVYLEKVDEFNIENETLDATIDIFTETLEIPSDIGTEFNSVNSENQVQARLMEKSYYVRCIEGGKFDLYMSLGMPSNYGYKITLYVNDEEQSYGEGKDVGTGWNSYNYYNIGTITLPKGISKITIKSEYAYDYDHVQQKATNYYGFFYYNKFKLVHSGVGVLASTYNAESSSCTTESLNFAYVANVSTEENTNNIVSLAPTQNVVFDINAQSSGLYSLRAIANSKTNNAKVKLDVNGNTNILYPEWDITRRYEYVDLGTVYLNAGTNELKITLEQGNVVNIYKLFVDEAQITFHSGTSSTGNSSRKISEIIVPEGGKENFNLTARADLNGTLTGENALYTVALYKVTSNGTKLEGVNAMNLADIAETTVQDLSIKGITLEEGATYTAKVFVWDNATLFGVSEIY